MQLSDDIFHITHLPLELKVSLQVLAGIHFENQHSRDDMENSLKGGHGKIYSEFIV